MYKKNIHRAILFILCSFICEIYSVDNRKKILTITQRIKRYINRKLVTVCYISKMDLSTKSDLPTFDHSHKFAYTKQIEHSFHRSSIRYFHNVEDRIFSHLLTEKKKKNKATSLSLSYSHSINKNTTMGFSDRLR